MTTIKTVPLKPYTVTELAKVYGVCNRTFKKWIKDYKDLGEKVGRYYSIPQVKIIFERLMLPTNLQVEVQVQKSGIDLP